ncbi:hypothetical protein ACQFN5_17145 [Klebsiella sp. WOUb02]|uniref:hypothetical protein n=1 Tax=Klebsiella sp. WOUb02 TaxID=3161071 RepID=UPI003CEDA5AB
MLINKITLRQYNKFPYADARSWYGDDPKARWDSALRNASLQAGYFIIAARRAGLDTNPMPGLDESALNSTFSREQYQG